MTSGFMQFLNGIAGLAFASTAAAIAATIMRDELMPVQLKWLGASGIVVAACVLVIAFAFRSVIIKAGVKCAAFVVLLSAMSCVIYLRATRVEDISFNSQSYSFMTGWRLSTYGEDARRRCLTATNRQNTDYLSDYDLVKCAGPDEIRSLYRDYSAAGLIYSVGYLMLLASFTLLVSSVQLIEKA